MIKHFFPNPAVFKQLHAGPFGAYIDAFAQEVSDRGYAIWTAKYAMRLLAALGTWLEQEELAISDLDEPAIDAFLRCRYRGFCQHRDDRAVLAFVLAYLREKGLIAPMAEQQATDEGSPVREAFRRHLVSQRNLAPSTVRTYLDTVGRFLGWRFGKQSLELGALCAQDVTGFMLEQARRYSAGHTQLIASGLRGFLRFCSRAGPSPRIWPSTCRRRHVGSCRACRSSCRPRTSSACCSPSIRIVRKAGAITPLYCSWPVWACGPGRWPPCAWRTWIGTQGNWSIHGKGGRVERLPLPWDVGEALSRLPARCPTAVFHTAGVCLLARTAAWLPQRQRGRHHRAPCFGPRRSASPAPRRPSAAPFLGHPIAAQRRLPGRDRRVVTPSQPRHHPDLR